MVFHVYILIPYPSPVYSPSSPKDPNDPSSQIPTTNDINSIVYVSYSLCHLRTLVLLCCVSLNHSNILPRYAVTLPNPLAFTDKTQQCTGLPAPSPQQSLETQLRAEAWLDQHIRHFSRPGSQPSIQSSAGDGGWLSVLDRCGEQEQGHKLGTDFHFLPFSQCTSILHPSVTLRVPSPELFYSKSPTSSHNRGGCDHVKETIKF